MSSAMEIGLFQLENLLGTPTLFVLLNLSAQESSTVPEVERILRRCEKVPASEVEGHLRARQVPLTAPLVLLCENGQTSLKTVDRLSQLGFLQLYIVAGGIEGLLAEL